MLKFREIDHRYESVIPDNRVWKSVTGIIHSLTPEFNSLEVATRCSQDGGSDWYGMPVDEILRIWKEENERSTRVGHQFHAIQELREPQDNICKVEDGWKYAGSQVLTDGLYPEFILYHPEYNVCGTADKITVKDNVAYVRDYKTCKVIKKEGFRGQKMLYPAENVDHCELGHYSLQLSIYAYMLQYHNPGIQIADMYLDHVLFEVESYNAWGYPHVKMDDNGEPVVKEIIPIKVPFLRSTAEAVLKHHKEQQNGRQQELRPGNYKDVHSECE